jgi:ketosteroid isomerase-like protein
MNEAVPLLRRVFGLEGSGQDVFAARVGDDDPFAHIHPDAVHQLFGPTGTKEVLEGREAFVAFVDRCLGALAAHEDEILAITPIDEHGALVHARAYRRSAASGEELRYEWAMLYRVEQGQITYATDMLDPDAQAFWGRILSPVTA